MVVLQIKVSTDAPEYNQLRRLTFTSLSLFGSIFSAMELNGESATPFL